MPSAQRIGRLFGLLILVQAVAAPVLNFVLLQPAMSSAAGFLVDAAPRASQVRLGVGLGLVVATIPVAMALLAWPLFRRDSPVLARACVVLACAGLLLAAVEGWLLLELLALSQDYHAADAAGQANRAAQGGGTVLSLRMACHYTGLVAGGAINLAFYAAMYRGALIWRPWAAFGMAAAALLMTSALLPLFGGHVVLALMLPLGLCHLALAAWLLWRGFPERPAAVADATAA
jgi:hypothetical protein